MIIDGLDSLDSATTPVETAMTGNAVEIGADATLDAALSKMESAGVNSVAVMDGGNLVGIFTSADAARLLRRALA